jgi:hypothetical protein
MLERQGQLQKKRTAISAVRFVLVQFVSVLWRLPMTTAVAST